MEVRYSINGNYFRDFGVFVSESKGIADTLKRKKVNSYEWAEYHGISVDLEKPKYEARNIELRCFIVGDNWEELFADFNKLIRDEFSKPGTQRLLIEPFSYKAMPYEVYMSDDINVEKQFREGKMHATFSIKMIEPNPVKKVLYFTGEKLDLSFNCPSETEIFYGNGLNKEVAHGNVSLSGKTLANRVVSGYNFEGRNFVKGNHNINVWVANDVGTLNTVSYGPYNGKQSLVFTASNHVSAYNAIPIDLEEGKTYTISLWAGQNTLNQPETILNIQLFGLYNIQESMVFFGYQKFTYTFTYHGGGSRLLGLESLSKNLYISDIQIIEGTEPKAFIIAPEDEKYIIIAGNIEEITNLQTNAQVLWEKL